MSPIYLTKSCIYPHQKKQSMRILAQYIEKGPGNGCIRKWTQVNTLNIRTRALYICKCALHIRKRALEMVAYAYEYKWMLYTSAQEPYISANEPCISAKEPYTSTPTKQSLQMLARYMEKEPWKWLCMHMNTGKWSTHQHKSRICPQMSPIYV